MDILTIGDRKFPYIKRGDGGPLFIHITGAHESDPEELLMKADGLSDRLKDLTLVTVAVTDWDTDLSPWEADTPDGRHFSGGGTDFLRELRDTILPEVRKELSCSGPVYLLGYSLAGLFSLAALYVTDVFSGAACCSGSLWFPGWMEYAEGQRIRAEADIYLSLGGKEPRSKDPLMATVGTCYKKQEQLLKKDAAVRHLIYEMNPGGHFADPVKRTAKGLVKLYEDHMS